MTDCFGREIKQGISVSVLYNLTVVDKFNFLLGNQRLNALKVNL